MEIKPAHWVPSLYFAQGIPYVVVMTLSVIFYKKFNISNADIAVYTSLLYLPWVIKPFWSPFVDMFKTKRQWIVVMQLTISVLLLGLGFVVPAKFFFFGSLAILWVVAFASSTHDIAADGFYMLGLSPHDQTWWVGIRSTFYRLATIFGSGLLVMLAGVLETKTGNIPLAWSVTFFALGAFFLVCCAWHAMRLPCPTTDVPVRSKAKWSEDFLAAWVSFFKKPGIGSALAFILLYRFAEAQSVKLLSPFLLDARDRGGLGLTTAQLGLTYGTIGVVALTIGGLLGGFLAARHGLKKMLPVMVCAIHLPNLALVYLSYVQPTSQYLIDSSVALEQFGYGFGFTAYMLYLLSFADGEHKTAHYAICTGFMALGMMLPGIFSGHLQEWLGYRHFFLWVMLATIPGFLVAFQIKIDPEFGKRNAVPKPTPVGLKA